MKQTLRFFLVLVLTSSVMRAQTVVQGYAPSLNQTHVKPFRPNLQIGAAFAYSVINNRKEVRGQYKPGIDLRLMAQLRPAFGVSLAYSHHIKHNSSPAFDDIRAYNVDLDGHFIMRMGESDLFFSMLFGVTYLNWTGTYVGPTLNDNNSYYPGLVIHQPWVGGNFGVGFNHQIWRNINGFSEFRLRIVSQDKDLLSISDTAFRFGICTPIAQGKAKRASNDSQSGSSTKKETPKTGSGKGKNNNAKSGRKYDWLKKRN